jgi:hypothetical protein
MFLLLNVFNSFRILRVKNMDIKKMGVNKNIRILMLFDCVRVCPSLETTEI